MATARAKVIKTGGGTFDPDDRIIYFAAGNSREAFPKHMLAAVNDLGGKGPSPRLDMLLGKGYKVMLDSGIFWLTNEHKRKTGMSMNEALSLPPEAIDGFEALFERYVYLAQTYEERLWGYVELDQGGRDNKIRTRKRLHDLGLNPMPVYHPLNDGWDYFDELARGYDRICFGNIVQASPAVRVRLLHTMWERRRQYPRLWVHVLGLTANEMCLPFPPDSCDSSSWLNGVRWPTASTEVAMMRRLSTLDHRFRYVRGGDDTQDANMATTMYADSVTHSNTIWRDALDARPGEPYPKRRVKEGPLQPWTAQQA